MKHELLRTSHFIPSIRRLGCYVSVLTLAITLTAAVASADSVTAVSCSTPTAAFQSDVASCDALGWYGYSKATSTSSVTLPSAAGQAAVIEATSTAIALQTGIHGIAGTATAQSSADVGIVFDTTGAARDGLLEITFTQNNWTVPLNGFISEGLTIGSYTASLNGSSLSSIWIPVQLGGQFGFDYTQSLTAIGSSGSGLTSGGIDSLITLRAFEADGTTGVQLFDPPGSPAPLLATPEPASIGMIGAGIAGLSLLLWRRR